jgi:hypothetical protein
MTMCVMCSQVEVSATGGSLVQSSSMDDSMSVVCCQVEVSVRGRSLVQKSPTVFVCVIVIRWNSYPLYLQ